MQPATVRVSTTSLRGAINGPRQPATVLVSTTIPFIDAALEEGENIPEGLSAVRCYWPGSSTRKPRSIQGMVVHSFMEDWYIHLWNIGTFIYGILVQTWTKLLRCSTAEEPPDSTGSGEVS